MNVANEYKIETSNDMEAFVKKFDIINPIWSDLLTIDYFYHSHMSTYDDGLSFIDRIYSKLGKFHPEWNVTDLKNCVIYARNPVSTYSDIIRFMFSDHRDVMYYGI